jgi:hypothetical protein
VVALPNDLPQPAVAGATANALGPSDEIGLSRRYDAGDPAPDQASITQWILNSIDSAADRLSADMRSTSRQGCGVAVLDDLLPSAWRDEILRGVPPRESMLRLKSLGERKFCMAQTSAMTSALRNCVAAFASTPIADKLATVMGRNELAPDGALYNGGVTVMSPGDFMRPHLDNSHNRDRNRQRRLVVLYYLSSPWRPEDGGALTIWSRKPLRRLHVIPYRPNRLVLMELGAEAWHSVDPVRGASDRVNLTTYFYDAEETRTPVHLTRFMGWPGQAFTNAILEAQFRLRMLAQKAGAGRFARNHHIDDDASLAAERLKT